MANKPKFPLEVIAAANLTQAATEAVKEADVTNIIHKIGIKLPVSAWEAFDAAWQRAGYKSRSDAIRDILEKFLAQPNLIMDTNRVGQYRVQAPNEKIVERIVYLRYSQFVTVGKLADMLGTSKRAIVRAAIEYFVEQAAK